MSLDVIRSSFKLLKAIQFLIFLVLTYFFEIFNLYATEIEVKNQIKINWEQLTTHPRPFFSNHVTKCGSQKYVFLLNL